MTRVHDPSLVNSPSLAIRETIANLPTFAGTHQCQGFSARSETVSLLKLRHKTYRRLM